MGAEYIIAIDLYTRPAHPEYMNSPLVKYIKTTWDLSYLLHFNQESVERNRALGYNDTMKAFDKLVGFRYTFSKQQDNSHIQFADNFARQILLFESNLPSKSIILRKVISNPLSKSINEYAEDRLSVSGFFIRGLEICMEILNYEPTEIYNVHDVTTDILKRFFNRESYLYSDLFKNTSTLSMKIDKEYLVGCILYKMLDSETFTDDIYILSNLFPRETTAAFYLYSLMT